MNTYLQLVFGGLLIAQLVSSQNPGTGAGAGAMGLGAGAMGRGAGAMGRGLGAMGGRMGGMAAMGNPMGPGRPFVPGMTAGQVSDLMGGRPGPVPMDLANRAAAMSAMGQTADQIADTLGDVLQARRAMARRFGAGMGAGPGMGPGALAGLMG